MTTIIVTHEDNEVDEFEFEAGHDTISIGRRSSNDVCVPNLSISGNHARITLQGSEAWLEDLNSTNGSYVNGQVINRTVINNGDDIILGKIRLAFVHTPATVSANAPAATVSAAQTTEATSHIVERAPVLEGAGEDMDDSLPEHKTDQRQTTEPASKAATAEGNPAVDDDEMSFDEDARMFAQPPVETPRNRSTVAPLANGLTNAQSDDQAISTANPQEAPHPLDGVERQPPAASLTKNESSDAPPLHELDNAPATSKGAVIEIKNGAKSGQILPIDKPVTTLGRPGIQIAAIMRKPDGYFLMHIESDDSVDRPTLNQDAIGDEPVLLHSGDELNVAGIDVEFMLS